jgi:myo-inositol-1(or 4)-monophosphatase
MNADSRRETALAAARAGSLVAEDRFRTDLTVDTKDGKTDVVTAADRDAQRAVRDRLREAYPDEPIVGEENDAPTTVPPEGPAWIVDPIDGTNNYVREFPTWVTAVTSVVDGEPVASAIVAPALEDTYVAGEDGSTRNGTAITVSEIDDPDAGVVCPTLWWPRDRRDEYSAIATALLQAFGDIRRHGSAQLELALVASGTLDGVVSNILANPWDTVAGVQLVRQAGGTVTDLDGARWQHDSTGLVASNGAIHDSLLAAAQAADDRFGTPSA